MYKKTILLAVILAFSSTITSCRTLNSWSGQDGQQYVFEKTHASIVRLEDPKTGGWGTGFFAMTKSGAKVIITNAHICEISLNAPIFLVYHRTKDFTNVRSAKPVKMLKKYANSDLCIVSAPTDYDAPALPLADDVVIDAPIYIIGYPQISILSSSSGYVRGYAISDGGYPLPIEFCTDPKFHIVTFKSREYCFLRIEAMFTDAPGDKGQSGSPGFNSDGEVIGVMSMIIGEYRSFSMLVPLSALKQFLLEN